jgi:hypothetical protein
VTDTEAAIVFVACMLAITTTAVFALLKSDE